MSKQKRRYLIDFILVTICFLTHAEVLLAQIEIREAIVKIHTTRRPPDFIRPWSKGRPQEISGSGVVISGNRILTNAHVVDYAKSVHVQAHQSSQRKEAKVLFIAQDMDLALLEVKDTDFYKDRPALKLATKVPKLKDVVTVYGFPIGGEQLSITEGIVSRIESTSYRLEGYGLRIQVDAALNPGNSGGPAVSGDEILGLVFSGIAQADNIGYLIPAEEIVTFLSDVEDGSYDGKPRLYGGFQTVENKALRNKLKLGELGGMMVTEPISDEDDYPLKEFDVITHVGELELDQQGNIQIDDDLKLAFHYAVPRCSKDGKVPLTILRDGTSIKVEVPVRQRRDLLIQALRGTYPSYFVYGPMVFTAASQELLAGLRGGGEFMLAARRNSMLSRRFAKPEQEGEEIVILGARLFPHPISEGYDPQFFATVDEVNGTKVLNLKHLVTLLRDAKDEFIVLRLGGSYETLVFRRDELAAATDEILEDEGIRSQYSQDIEKVWDGED